MQRAFKEFPCIGDAIREVERLTSVDSIEDEGQCGESLHCFLCQETEEVVSGWACGKYLFDCWADSPRKALEEWSDMRFEMIKASGYPFSSHVNKCDLKPWKSI